jgi:hypothetical protein
MEAAATGTEEKGSSAMLKMTVSEAPVFQNSSFAYTVTLCKPAANPVSVTFPANVTFSFPLRLWPVHEACLLTVNSKVTFAAVYVVLSGVIIQVGDSVN